DVVKHLVRDPQVYVTVDQPGNDRPALGVDDERAVGDRRPRRADVADPTALVDQERVAGEWFLGSRIEQTGADDGERWHLSPPKARRLPRCDGSIARRRSSQCPAVQSR